jgi:hypothetical protein
MTISFARHQFPPAITRVVIRHPDPFTETPQRCEKAATPNLTRAIPDREKSRRFARTSWWSGGDSNRWPSRRLGTLDLRDFASESQERAWLDE